MIIGILMGPGGKRQPRTQHFQKSCDLLQIEYILVDMKSANWLSKFQSFYKSIDGLLASPPCVNSEEYDIYMERLYFIKKEYGIPIYPSYDELKLYENKRYCSYWLEKNGYSAPKSKVFCDKKETLEFIRNCSYPIVLKAPIGSAASAVHIIRNKLHARMVVSQIYGMHRVLSFGYVSWVREAKTKLPIPLLGSSLKHNVIIQEFIPIKWEWRIIKIGESYFGHQKLLKGKYASGSGKVGWVDPPKHLLDLIRDVCERGNFNSMAMDVFESKDGQFYINELQSMFGSYINSQMYIDGVPGRYVYDNGQYVFERGYFNICGSCLLRVKHFAELMSGKTINLKSISEIWNV